MAPPSAPASSPHGAHQQRLQRMSPRLGAMRPLALVCLLLCLVLACASLWLPAVAQPSVCAFTPNPLPLVDPVGSDSSLSPCDQSLGVNASSSCTVQCDAGAVLLGGPSFRCSQSAYWLSQPHCASWSAPSAAGAGGPFVGKLLALVSRTPEAAAEQLQRHAAADTLTDVSGWELLAVRQIGAEPPSLMVSRDGLKWIARPLPAGVATLDAFKLPALTITPTGRVTILRTLLGSFGDLGSRSDEALLEWTPLDQSSSDPSAASPRLGTGAALVPGSPHVVVFGGGARDAGGGMAEDVSDVWMYTDSELGVGTFKQMTTGAQWSVRTNPNFVFQPAGVPEPDPITGVLPGFSTPVLLCLGSSLGAMTDAWKSHDYGSTWTALGAAPFAFRNTVVMAGVVWSLRQFNTAAGRDTFELWQSPDARTWTRVSAGDWRPPLPSVDGATGADANPLSFPIVHRRDLVVFRLHPSASSDPRAPRILNRTVLAQGSIAAMRGWEAPFEGEATTEEPAELIFSPPFDWSVSSYTAWAPRPQNLTAISADEIAPLAPTFFWAADRTFGNVTVLCTSDPEPVRPLDRVQVPLPVSGLARSSPLSCGGLAHDATEVRLSIVAPDAVYAIHVLRAPLRLLEVPGHRVPNPLTLAPAFHWQRRAYTVTVPAGRLFPSELELQLRVAFGSVNVSAIFLDTPQTPDAEVTSVEPADESTTVVLPLPRRGSWGAPGTAAPVVLLQTLVGTYTITVLNPCGFDGDEMDGPGARCPPHSVCLPLSADDPSGSVSGGFECSPAIRAQSLQIWQVPDADPSSATTLPSVPSSDASSIQVLLPPLSPQPRPERLRVTFRADSLAQASGGFVIQPNITFAADGVDPDAGYGYGIGACSDLALLPPLPSADPTQQEYECWLPRGPLLGLHMRVTWRVCSLRAQAEIDAAADAGRPITRTACWTQRSPDSFSSPPPFFLNRTVIAANPLLSLERLLPVADRAGPSGDLVAQGMLETLAMSVGNFLPGAGGGSARVIYASESALLGFYEAAKQTPLTPPMFDQLALELYAANCTLLPEAAFERVVCLTPDTAPFSGQPLPFLVYVAGQLTPALSEETYSYPVRPRVDRVSGCTDRANSTMDCPTNGGVRITLSGAGFSLTDLAISVAGMDCPAVEARESGVIASCMLPAGTGNSVSVTVSSFGILSISLPLLSYAKPNITSVACDACEETSVDAVNGAVRLAQCARSSAPDEPASRRVLRLTGSNFGPEGSTVFIGSVICGRDAAAAGIMPRANASESESDVLPPDTDSSVSCFLPPGKSVTQPVLLIQNNGKISESAHMVSYTPCPAGSYDPAPQDSSSLGCDLCDVGKYSAIPGAVACSTCPAGSVAPEVGALGCAPCAPRTFQAKEGGSECATCPSGAYAPTAGSSTCNHCPAGLYLGSSSPNASSADCLSCPEGGECSGQIITSATDYYLRLERDGNVRAFQCPSGYCTACDMVALADRNDTAVGAYGGSGSSSSANGSHALLATVLTCCTANRDPSTPLCGVCVPGYEDWSGTCKRCTHSNGGLVFAFLLLSTLLVGWLAHSASNSSVGLTAIALYFVQTASLELGSGAVLVAWLQAINFNPDFLTSESSCVVELNAYGQTVFSILTPFILLAELALIAAVHALLHRRMSAAAAAARAQPPPPPPPPTADDLSGSDSTGDESTDRPAAALSPSVRVQAAATALATKSREHVHQWASSFTIPYYANAVIAVLQFSYTGVSSAAIKFLWCVDVGDDSVVFAQPGMNCDSAEYKRVLPLVVVAIIGFVAAFPLAVAVGGLYRHLRLTSRRQSVVARVNSAALLTPLYGVFRPGAWYWSSFVLLRRSIFVVLDAVLASEPRYRAFSFGLVNQFSYFCSLYAAPFPERVLNRLESASQMSLLLISALLTVQLPPYTDAMNAMLLLVLLLTVLALLAGACLQQRDKIRSVLSFPSASASISSNRARPDNPSHRSNGRNSDGGGDDSGDASHPALDVQVRESELSSLPAHCHPSSPPVSAPAPAPAPSNGHSVPRSDLVHDAAIDVEIVDAHGGNGADAAGWDAGDAVPLGSARSDDQVAL